MYKLIVSELAHQDLDHIISYIAVELENPIAATNLLNEIEKCYDYLKNNPLMYGQCFDPRLKKEGYRKAVIKHYILIYKFDKSAKVVNIFRFFYGAQDYMKQI